MQKSLHQTIILNKSFNVVFVNITDKKEDFQNDTFTICSTVESGWRSWKRDAFVSRYFRAVMGPFL